MGVRPPEAVGDPVIRPGAAPLVRFHETPRNPGWMHRQCGGGRSVWSLKPGSPKIFNAEDTEDTEAELLVRAPLRPLRPLRSKIRASAGFRLVNHRDTKTPRPIQISVSSCLRG